MIKEIAYSGVLLALSSSSIILASSIMLKIPIDPWILFAAFSVVFFTYNMNRWSETDLDIGSHPERTRFIVKHKKQIVLFSVLFGVIGLLISTKNVYSLITYLFLVVWASAYNIKWIPKTEKLKIRSTKDIPLFKAAVPSIGWAALSSVYLAYFVGREVDISIMLLFLFVFIRFFIDVTVFDIRDFENDKKNNVKTLPVVFGVEKTIKILHLLNLASFFVLAVPTYLGKFHKSAYYLAVFVSFLGIYYISKIDKQCDKNFLCDIVVDGAFILWGLITYLGTF